MYLFAVSPLSACCSTTSADTATTPIHLPHFLSMSFTKSPRAAPPFSFIRRRLRPAAGKSSSFFTITGRKRGGAFDSHEPSSPKVTCIGQVRVKSKKRVKQCRRRIGEVSFRTAEQSHGGGGNQLIEDRDKVWIRSQRLSSSSVHSHREQRWVHLPISVCEALRAFRDEICCFLPSCGCSCFSREREKDEERDYYGGERENGCGAVLARWLGADDGGEDEKRREIAVVVGGGDEDGSEMMSIRSSRRHVFEDIVVNEDEGEEARVSICIPPKNALLLMRCRSDPMKMASLTNRFSLDLPKIEIEQDVEEEIEEENHGGEAVDFEEDEGKVVISVAEIENEGEGEIEGESNLEMQVGDNDCEDEVEEEKEEQIEENEAELIEKVAESDISSFVCVSEDENTQNVSESGEKLEREKDEEEDEKTEELERETTKDEDEDEKAVQPIESEIEKPEIRETAIVNQTATPTIKENKSSSLPECLLLMMCEPKLSMEVSKETWVRGTDFIRLLPERPRKPAKTVAGGGGEHELVKRRPSVDSKSKPRVPAPPKKHEQQPARSSCSLPAASIAGVVERNQASARRCEPFSLTRCKSEPMSTAAAKLMPESCCWKNNSGMKMEPHRQAALGVGAAGVGF